MSRLHFLVLALLPASAIGTGALAAEPPQMLLVMKDHRFTPPELKVPAGQRVKLLVQNQDTTPEEFESHDLNREKVVPAGATATIFIGPLKPGRYSFFGEFHQESAKGAVIAE